MTDSKVSQTAEAPSAEAAESPKLACSPWDGLGRPSLAVISIKLGVEDSLSKCPEWWTSERCSLAAEALVDKYPNPTSAATMLTKLRIALLKIGVPRECVVLTHRKDLSQFLLREQARARIDSVTAGMNLPEPYLRIRDLKERVEAFINAPAATPATAQDAADFLVAFSARPGEAILLDLGVRGGVIGMLKKRGADPKEYPIMSAIGSELAEKLIVAWRSRPVASRIAAMNALPALTKTWGRTPKDLRVFGGELAVRAEAIEGRIETAGAAYSVRRQALRHGEPEEAETKAKPTSFYEKVVDPNAQRLAKLKELPARDRDDVMAYIDFRIARAEPQAAPQDATQTRSSEPSLSDILSLEAGSGLP